MRTERVSKTRWQQLQHDRLAGLLAELEQKHGPIDPRVLEEVRQEWPTPQERAAKRRRDD